MALACGACYGVSAFAVKLVTSEFSGGAAKVFTNWPISIVWLNVVLHDSPAAIFGEVASLVLMIAGIVVTAQNSPHVTRRAEPTPAPPADRRNGLPQAG